MAGEVGRVAQFGAIHELPLRGNGRNIFPFGDDVRPYEGSDPLPPAPRACFAIPANSKGRNLGEGNERKDEEGQL
jgi:hypothetical protein